MIGVNKVILLGRVASDFELKTTGSGKSLVRFGVAIPRKDAEGKDATSFFDVVAWNRLAEVCDRYLQKGDKLFLEGRLTKSAWQTPDGEKRSRIEVTATQLSLLGSAANSDRQDPDVVAVPRLVDSV